MLAYVMNTYTFNGATDGQHVVTQTAHKVMVSGKDPNLKKQKQHMNECRLQLESL